MDIKDAEQQLVSGVTRIIKLCILFSLIVIVLTILWLLSYIPIVSIFTNRIMLNKSTGNPTLFAYVGEPFRAVLDKIFPFALIILVILIIFALIYVFIDRYLSDAIGPIFAPFVKIILNLMPFQVIKETGLVDLMDTLIYVLPDIESNDERIRVASDALGKFMLQTISFATEEGIVPIETSNPSALLIKSNTYKECLKEKQRELTPDMSPMERAQVIAYNSKIRTKCKSLKLRQNK